MLEEKVRPYIQNVENEVLSKPIVLRSQNQDQKVFLSSLLFTYCLLILVIISSWA